MLAHLSANNNDDGKGIQLFRVNRNNMILIDSDKRSAQSRLNETKKRIIREIESDNGIAWVTKGREIENYIPADAIARVLGKVISNVPQQYESIFEWLDSVEEGKGTYFVGKKALLAEQIAPHLEQSTLAGIFDFHTQIKQVVQQIKLWNAME